MPLSLKLLFLPQLLLTHGLEQILKVLVCKRRAIIAVSMLSLFHDSECALFAAALQAPVRSTAQEAELLATVSAETYKKSFALALLAEEVNAWETAATASVEAACNRLVLIVQRVAKERQDILEAANSSILSSIHTAKKALEEINKAQSGTSRGDSMRSLYDSMSALNEPNTLFDAAIQLPKFQYLPSSTATTAAILDAACDGVLEGFLVSASK
jgi:hypothetical protein